MLDAHTKHDDEKRRCKKVLNGRIRVEAAHTTYQLSVIRCSADQCGPQTTIYADHSYRCTSVILLTVSFLLARNLRWIVGFLGGTTFKINILQTGTVMSGVATFVHPWSGG